MMRAQITNESRALSPRAALPAIAPDDDPFPLHGLRIFRTVPAHHHDVVALQGFVVVFETGPIGDEIADGGLYVAEHQRPPGGMNWETFDRLMMQHGPAEPRARLKTSRTVVRLVRDAADPALWWHIAAGGWRDGPFEHWGATLNLVGKVAGLYQPGAQA